MDFELIGPLRDVELIAAGREIRDLARLNRWYGRARWRKLKAIGVVRLDDDCVCRAELHWYEGHGRGKVEMRIKRILGERG